MLNLERKEYTQSAYSSNGLNILRTLTSDPTLMEDGPTRRGILQGFSEALEQVVDKLPTKEQLVAFQIASSSPSGWLHEIDDAVYEGDFNFGRDVEAFFVTVASLYIMMGHSSTEIFERLEHELDHYTAFERNGIPAELHLFLGKDEAGDSLVDALSVRPKFPEDISVEERFRIVREVVGAPKKPSEYDSRWL